MIGILALQGDVREHARVLGELGVDTRPVRRPEDLEGLEGIVLPGGESTTLSLLLQSSGLLSPLGQALESGLPAFGTCAGLVLLARRVLDGRPDQVGFGVLDCTVRRNGYGRQLDSFETLLQASPLSVATGQPDTPLPAVFIRAPVIESVGPEVEVLATLAGDGDDPDVPVACRSGSVLVSAFHPELTADRRLHRLFVAMVRERAGGSNRSGASEAVR
jgi:5'-phosphate synthase pdxT subunit